MEPSSVILTWEVALIPEQPFGFAMVVCCRLPAPVERHMLSQSTTTFALSEFVNGCQLDAARQATAKSEFREALVLTVEVVPDFETGA